MHACDRVETWRRQQVASDSYFILCFLGLVSRISGTSNQHFNIATVTRVADRQNHPPKKNQMIRDAPQRTISKSNIKIIIKNKSAGNNSNWDFSRRSKREETWGEADECANEESNREQITFKWSKVFSSILSRGRTDECMHSAQRTFCIETRKKQFFFSPSVARATNMRFPAVCAVLCVCASSTSRAQSMTVCPSKDEISLAILLNNDYLRIPNKQHTNM